MKNFGEYIKSLRKNRRLPLRKVAAKLDLDPSTLSKIERGERTANTSILPLLAEVFNEDEEKMLTILISDKIAKELVYTSNPEEILKVAEEKIKYLKNKNLKQGSLDL